MKTISIILLTIVLLSALINIKLINIITDKDKDSEIAYWKSLFYEMRKQYFEYREKHKDDKN